MNIKESYIMAISRAHLTTYEARLLLMSINSGQALLKHRTLSHEHGVLQHTYNMVELVVPIRDITTDKGQHYEHVIKAAQELTRKNFTWRDDMGANKGHWVTFPWVLRAEHLAKSGCVKLILDKRFYDALYNFTMGHCKFDLERALKFKTVAAARLYPLINTQRNPITYPIGAMKEWLGVADKYQRGNDFIKRIIEPAKKEMDASEGNTFTYTLRRGPNNKITHITITTLWRATEAEKDASIGAMKEWLGRDLMLLLLHHGGFTSMQVQRNKKVLERFAQIQDADNLLCDIINRARKRRPANLQGYIINAIKDELKHGKRYGNTEGN